MNCQENLFIANCFIGWLCPPHRWVFLSVCGLWSYVSNLSLCGFC